MKKIILILSIFAHSLSAQMACNKYVRPCFQFTNLDNLQNYQDILSLTGATVAPCVFPTPCFQWQNLDNMQINAAIRTLTTLGAPKANYDSLRNTFIGQTPYNTGTVVTNFGNTAVGYNCLATHTIGLYNISIGFEAGKLASSSYECINIGWHAGYNGSGSGFCVGIGSGANFSNVNGQYNTSIGYSTLRDNTTDANSAYGYASSTKNTTGTQNSSFGMLSSNSNLTGSSNSSFGWGSVQMSTLSISNSAFGANSMQNIIRSSRNTAIGKDAMGAGSGLDCNDNSVLGYRGMYNVTTATDCQSIGSGALQANTSGSYNYAAGTAALAGNTTGFSNHVTGFQAMSQGINTGNNNEGYGEQVLYNNTSGSRNIALCYRSLFANTTGNDNFSAGSLAMASNTSGVNCAAIGSGALFSNRDGTDNLGIGKFSLYSNISGYQNIGFGFQSLYGNTSNNNTAIGYKSFIDLTTSGGTGNNVGLGNFTGAGVTTGSGNLFLGYNNASHNAATTNNIELNSGNINRYLFNGSTHNFVGPVNGSSLTIINPIIGVAATFSNNSNGLGGPSPITVNDGAGVLGLGYSSTNQYIRANSSNGLILQGGGFYGVSINTNLTVFGKIAAGNFAPSAMIHLDAGGGVAGTGAIKFTETNLLATPEKGVLEFSAGNLNFTGTSIQQKLSAIITASATLDFPSTLAGAASDLTVTVTGAALSDPVFLGIPNGSMPAAGTSGSYTGWVSASNVVTIRFMASPLSLYDPTSGSFKIVVNKNP